VFEPPLVLYWTRTIAPPEDAMTELPYARNIITDTKPYSTEDLARIEELKAKLPPVETTVEMTRLLWMDDTVVENAKIYMECVWLWGGETRAGLMGEPHVHDFPEVIGFISSDRDNPTELGAVMEMHLGDEVHYLTKSCLVHVPPGMKHCPLTFKRVDRPVFFFTLAPIGSYGRTSGLQDPEAVANTAFVPPSAPDETGTKYGRYIITEPKMHAPPPPPGRRPPRRTAAASHLVSLDDEASKGSFYVDVVWIWNGETTMSPEPHTHDFDEMIGIIGFDPDDPRGNERGIGGNVSILMGKDTYPITQSSLIYIPAGAPHCPLSFWDIKKPVLCFTLGTAAMWSRQGD
jgi:hypothetical protein